MENRINAVVSAADRETVIDAIAQIRTFFVDDTLRSRRARRLAIGKTQRTRQRIRTTRTKVHPKIKETSPLT